MDNGACYYYDTIKFPNYEDALVAVKEQADKDGVPFRYLQVCVHNKFLYTSCVFLLEYLYVCANINITAIFVLTGMCGLHKLD